jgi:hypothetical protein
LLDAEIKSLPKTIEEKRNAQQAEAALVKSAVKLEMELAEVHRRQRQWQEHREQEAKARRAQAYAAQEQGSQGPLLDQNLMRAMQRDNAKPPFMMGTKTTAASTDKGKGHGGAMTLKDFFEDLEQEMFGHNHFSATIDDFEHFVITKPQGSRRSRNTKGKEEASALDEVKTIGESTVKDNTAEETAPPESNTEDIEDIEAWEAALVADVLATFPPRERGVRDEWAAQKGVHRKEDLRHPGAVADVPPEKPPSSTVANQGGHHHHHHQRKRHRRHRGRG